MAFVPVPGRPGVLRNTQTGEEYTLEQPSYYAISSISYGTSPWIAAPDSPVMPALDGGSIGGLLPVQGLYRPGEVELVWADGHGVPRDCAERTFIADVLPRAPRPQHVRLAEVWVFTPMVTPSEGWWAQLRSVDGAGRILADWGPFPTATRAAGALYEHLGVERAAEPAEARPERALRFGPAK